MMATKWYTKALEEPKKDIKIKVVIPTNITLEIPWYSGHDVVYIPDEYHNLVEKIVQTLAKEFDILKIKPNPHLKHYVEDPVEKKKDFTEQAFEEMLNQVPAGGMVGGIAEQINFINVGLAAGQAAPIGGLGLIARNRVHDAIIMDELQIPRPADEQAF
jgi:hypothetical protein